MIDVVVGRLLTAVVSVVFSLSAALADTVVLENGTRLVGTARDIKGGILGLDTGFAGTIRIPTKVIVGITTDGIVTVRFSEGGYATGRFVTASDGGIRLVSTRDGTSIKVTPTEIAELHPGSDIPRGVQWTGFLNVGAVISSGNTDSQTYHIDTSATGRAERDRVRARADFNRELERETKTEDNYTIAVQHDRFVSKKLFFYTSAKLEHDDIAQLILRTTLSTGLGYQFIESDRTKLSVEVGPAYIIENFDNAPNDQSAAGRWAVNFDHYIFDRLAQLFHLHDGLVDLQQTGEILIDSSTGLRLFVRDGFTLAAQIDLDWDNRPPEDVSSLDKKYMLTVGYKW